MVLYSFNKQEQGEKVAAMTRAMGHGVQARIKKRDLSYIYPDPDIGPAYIEYHYRILTDFDVESEAIEEAISILLLAYANKKDVRNWRPWQMYYALAMKSFSHKINKMSNISKVSFMEQEVPENISRRHEEVPWL